MASTAAAKAEPLAFKDLQVRWTPTAGTFLNGRWTDASQMLALSLSSSSIVALPHCSAQRQRAQHFHIPKGSSPLFARTPMQECEQGQGDCAFHGELKLKGCNTVPRTGWRAGLLGWAGVCGKRESSDSNAFGLSRRALGKLRLTVSVRQKKRGGGPKTAMFVLISPPFLRFRG